MRPLAVFRGLGVRARLPQRRRCAAGGGCGGEGWTSALRGVTRLEGSVRMVFAIVGAALLLHGLVCSSLGVGAGGLALSRWAMRGRAVVSGVVRRGALALVLRALDLVDLELEGRNALGYFATRERGDGRASVRAGEDFLLGGPIGGGGELILRALLLRIVEVAQEEVVHVRLQLGLEVCHRSVDGEAGVASPGCVDVASVVGHEGAMCSDGVGEERGHGSDRSEVGEVFLLGSEQRLVGVSRGRALDRLQRCGAVRKECGLPVDSRQAGVLDEAELQGAREGDDTGCAVACCFELVKRTARYLECFARVEVGATGVVEPLPHEGLLQELSEQRGTLCGRRRDGCDGDGCSCESVCAHSGGVGGCKLWRRASGDWELCARSGGCVRHVAGGEGGGRQWWRGELGLVLRGAPRSGAG